MSKFEGFNLIAGISIPDTEKLKKEYKVSRDRIYFTISAEDYQGFFQKCVKLLPEAVFFFLEIPDDNDDFRLYYLDNCTQSVAQAILKRYSGILFSDGVIKYGFGSHTIDDEIYMMEYQTVSICSKDLSKYESVLSELGYQKNKNAVLSWDILNKDNVGECCNVESDDESYIDMVNNLIDVGMYPASN